MASLHYILPDNNTSVIVTRRESNDLPAHVQGTAIWTQPPNAAAGYYCLINGHNEAIEFINDQWHGLAYNPVRNQFSTRRRNAIARENDLGLGWWLPTDPTHPDYRAPSRTGFRFNPTSSDSSSSSTTVSVHSAQSIQSTHEPQSPAVPTPVPSLIATIATITPQIVPITTAPAPITAPVMAAPAPPVQPPTTGGLRGVAPTVFDGTRSQADEFWAQFRRYKLVNRTHDSMTKPFDRVLTALTYIRGPMINDWVNTQEEQLIQIASILRIQMALYSKPTKFCGPSSPPPSKTLGPTHLRNKTPMIS